MKTQFINDCCSRHPDAIIDDSNWEDGEVCVECAYWNRHLDLLFHLEHFLIDLRWSKEPARVRMLFEVGVAAVEKEDLNAILGATNAITAGMTEDAASEFGTYLAEYAAQY